MVGDEVIGGDERKVSGNIDGRILASAVWHDAHIRQPAERVRRHDRLRICEHDDLALLVLA